MELRRASAPDAEAVAEVWLRSRRASVPAIPPTVHDDDDVRQYIAGLVAEGGTWVAADGGGVVAMMTLGGGWIEHLHVDPDWTGRGIGGRLVALAQAQTAELDLWTFESNSAARRFYERWGFEVVGATDGDNEEGAPDVHYRWVRGGAGS